MKIASQQAVTSNKNKPVGHPPPPPHTSKMEALQKSRRANIRPAEPPFKALMSPLHSPGIGLVKAHQQMQVGQGEG